MRSPRIERPRVVLSRQKCQGPSGLNCLTLDRPVVHRPICIRDLEFDALGLFGIDGFECEVDSSTIKNPEQLVEGPQQFVPVSELIRSSSVYRHTLMLRRRFGLRCSDHALAPLCLPRGLRSLPPIEAPVHARSSDIKSDQSRETPLPGESAPKLACSGRESLRRGCAEVRLTLCPQQSGNRHAAKEASPWKLIR